MPATHLLTTAVLVNLDTSPVVANEITYNHGRAIIAGNKDVTALVTPLGGGVAQSVTINKGAILPVYFEAVDPQGDTVTIANGIAAPIIGSLVEEKVFAVAAQTFDFTATVDGDVDYRYRLMCFLVNDAVATISISLRLNVNTVAMARQVVTASAGGHPGARDTSPLLAGATTTEASTLYIDLVKPEVDDARHFTVSSAISEGTGIQIQRGSASITTPAIGDKITRIGVGASLADGLGVGTILRLYKWSP
jgi:hypothetical protein